MKCGDSVGVNDSKAAAAELKFDPSFSLAVHPFGQGAGSEKVQLLDDILAQVGWCTLTLGWERLVSTLETNVW